MVLIALPMQDFETRPAALAVILLGNQSLREFGFRIRVASLLAVHSREGVVRKGTRPNVPQDLPGKCLIISA